MSSSDSIGILRCTWPRYKFFPRHHSIAFLTDETDDETPAKLTYDSLRASVVIKIHGSFSNSTSARSLSGRESPLAVAHHRTVLESVALLTIRRRNLLYSLGFGWQFKLDRAWPAAAI